MPHQARWGIYELDPATQCVKSIFSTPNEINGSALRLTSTGDKFIFAQKADGSTEEDYEIYSMGIDGNNLTRLTPNKFMDLYPALSPDKIHIAFLSKREKDLDIYVMDADGNSVKKFYDSGSNDADIDWAERSIVFTSHSPSGK